MLDGMGWLPSLGCLVVCWDWLFRVGWAAQNSPGLPGMRWGILGGVCLDWVVVCWDAVGSLVWALLGGMGFPEQLRRALG